MRSVRFPRSDYQPLTLYDPGRTPVALDLSDNTNLWGPHPAAMEIVKSCSDATISRYPSVYGRGLKEAAARKFGVPPENVCTGCGSDDLLDSAFRASVHPPGRMTFPDPTFSMVHVFARINGLVSTPVPWVQAEAGPGALLDGAPDLVYICRPNNPTGASCSKDWVQNLLAEGEPSGPLVVVDEAYADYAEENLVQEALSSDRLLVLRTLSKLYGLAGLRVGFGIGPAHLIAEVEKSRGPYKVNGLAEAAAASALDDVSGWAAGIALETAANRERLRGELEARGLRPLPSEANFLLIPTRTEDSNLGRTGPEKSAIEINDGLKTWGVAGRPFPALNQIGDALRVSIGPWEMMERFLEALDQVRTGREGRI